MFIYRDGQIRLDIVNLPYEYDDEMLRNLPVELEVRSRHHSLSCKEAGKDQHLFKFVLR